MFLGLTTMGQNMSIPNLQRLLSQVLGTPGSAPGSSQSTVTAELMVHPGYPSHPQEGGCGDNPDEFSQSADRQHELSVLRDPSLLAMFREQGVHVCALKDL